MNFALLSSAGLSIQLHSIFALLAFTLGAFLLFNKKGTDTHKILGKIWSVAILLICLTSFWIKEIMPNSFFLGYSPIHLLSIFAIIQIIRGIYFAKIGNISKHKNIMISTYFGGLILAGAFAFYPDRLLYKIFIEVSL